MAAAFKRGKYSAYQKKEFPFVYLLIAFPVLQFLVFWLYVNASSIGMAFTTAQGAFTLDNFKNVWEGLTGVDIYGFSLSKVLLRSFVLWVIVNLGVFPISVCTTYVLFRRVKGHYFFRVCFLLPGLVGAVIWTTVVKYMVAYDGPVLEALKAMGVRFSPEVVRNGLFGSAKTAFPTVVAVSVFTGIVGGNAVLTGAFARVPGEIYEVGKLEGLGFWREFFTVCVPCIWPTVSMLFTFSLCTVFTADANTFLYSSGTGEPGMGTMGFYLYYLVLRISNAGVTTAYNYPAAIGFALTVITLPVVLFGRKLLEKAIEPVEY